MKHFGLAFTGALAAVFLGGQAFAEPEVCKVVLSSPEAGRLEVRKTVLPSLAESVVHEASSIDSTWSPVNAGSSVKVVLYYTAADQDKLIGNIVAVEIEFPQPASATADQFTAQLTVDGMAPLPLNQAAERMGTGRFAFLLDGSREADRNIGRLLGRGAHAKVLIFRADRVLQPEVFEGTQMSLSVLGEPKAIFSEEIDTTATAARDQLFAQAAPSIVARDSKICTPLRYISGVLVEQSPDN